MKLHRKIAFFSESDFKGKHTRNSSNPRVDVAWQIALDAIHKDFKTLFNFNKQEKQVWDLGIAIIPKNAPADEAIKYDVLFDKMRFICKKVSVMQEGPYYQYQNLPIQMQIWYHQMLENADAVFCHNRSDQKYFRGLVSNRNKVFTLPSVMITDHVQRKPKENKIIIGGNLCSWYGAIDSYQIAAEFDLPIYAPSMGRMPTDEQYIENLNHLPYMPWLDWMKELSAFKYAVHLMPTHAAGSFALNTSYLGIPCIGYRGLDTQEILHPDLSVNLGDLESARILAKSLAFNHDFYNHCVQTTINNYKKYYTEEAFLKEWKNASSFLYPAQ